jgi:LysR family transcriptional regulator (chromosome initiation inhibitor)
VAPTKASSIRHVAGRLIELAPAHPIEVKLYWTVVRIHAASLQALTEAVLAAAKAGLQA